MAWTTVGDATGFHLLVAQERAGYAWRTVATLSEPGWETDRWIGTACVTSSGHRAVVVYAPRGFSNKPELASRGAFTAIVDLRSGAIRKLAVRSSLAYFNPGCGSGEAAVLTQEGHEDHAQTRLLRLDASTGRIAKPIVTPGQVTSAVPAGGEIVAASGAQLVRFDGNGRLTRVANAAGVPFDLRVDGTGAVVFTDRVARQVRIRRVHQRSVRTVATGDLHKVGTARGTNGRVFVTGIPTSTTPLPATMTRIDAPPAAEVSTLGRLAVTEILGSAVGQPSAELSKPPPVEPKDRESAVPVRIKAQVTSTRHAVAFTVDPAASTSRRIAEGSTATAPGKTGGAEGPSAFAGSPTNPIEPERYCAIQRNDPATMAYQPTARQVEWAADMAVNNALTATRHANWKKWGMPAYSAQGMFPRLPLAGGGRVPVQVFLGILAQESNLWQASKHQLSGEFGNPLIGNYYGREIYDSDESNDWDIRWERSDCGYGIAQVTDGMRLPEHPKGNEPQLPATQQRAVALDYTVNIARGLQILTEKWNQTYSAGVWIHDAKPDKIENWFYAVWAYNTGFYPDKGDGSPWGLGWLNNPVNPRYPANRAPFLEESYGDAAKPHRWPYSEKVLGWAGHPIGTNDGPGFRAAWWTSVDNRKSVKPPVDLFCKPSNQCVPGATFPPDADDVIGEPPGPCDHRNAAGKRDLRCYSHHIAAWKADYCASSCGNELVRFDPPYAEPQDGTNYPPKCAADGLPSGALVIDDVPNSAPLYRCSARGPSNGGTFSLRFASDTQGNYPSKIDFHQIAGGYNGHFWFAHTQLPTATRPSGQGDKLKVTGTWTPGQRLNGWVRVMVHIPDHGAHTQQARYVVRTGTGDRIRYIPTRLEKNKWVNLGVFNFGGTGAQGVVLDNHTGDGLGDEDVAWDAAAFVPLAAKPKHFVVALGDSYASGEGANDYFYESNNRFGKATWNACRRSLNAWPRYMRLPGMFDRVGAVADSANPTVDFQFAACSGARSTQMWTNEPSYWRQAPDDMGEFIRTADGQFREWAQVDSGVLSTDTTLVTLSIGGNDAGFPYVMNTCARGDCDTSEFERERESAIDSAGNDVKALIGRIRAKAPNAQIVLMGYPRIFEDSPTLPCSLVYSTTEMAMLNRLSDHMFRVQRQVVNSFKDRGEPVEFAETITKFKDNAACDDVEWISAAVIGPEGEGDFNELPGVQVPCLRINGVGPCVSRESFHPKPEGAMAYAWVLEDKLFEIGYRGNP